MGEFASNTESVSLGAAKLRTLEVSATWPQSLTVMLSELTLAGAAHPAGRSGRLLTALSSISLN